MGDVEGARHVRSGLTHHLYSEASGRKLDVEASLLSDTFRAHGVGNVASGEEALNSSRKETQDLEQHDLSIENPQTKQRMMRNHAKIAEP